MRVVRGRAADRTADREVTQDLIESVQHGGEPVVRVWAPGRQVAFGRRDTNEDGYEDARGAARAHGFPPVERQVGGRAVAYTANTLAFARIEPIEDIRTGLEDRYDTAVADVLSALEAIGVDASEGEPADSFCPGAHSIAADGKIVGIAQRVTKGAALTSGVVIVADEGQLAGVLTDVYEALGLPFDPESVGSIESAGGDARRTLAELENALVGDAPKRVEWVRRT